jgi:predicted GNAT family N-acyltransferase
MSTARDRTADALVHKIESLPTGADLEEVERLRYRIYCDEQAKPMPNANHAARRLSDLLDPTAAHFVIRREGRVVACARLNVLDVTHAECERAGIDRLQELGFHRVAFMSKLMVDESHRRVSPMAARLMKHMAEKAIAQGLLVGLCHCSSRLIALYQRVGLSPLAGRSWHDPGAGWQQAMVVFADSLLARGVKSNAVDSREAIADATRERLAGARRLLGLAEPQVELPVAQALRSIASSTRSQDAPLPGPLWGDEFFAAGVPDGPQAAAQHLLQGVRAR